MTRLQFGNIDAADAVREEYSEHVAEADDARYKAVILNDETPEDVIEQIELERADSQGTSGSAAGQVELTDKEKKQVDFSEAPYRRVTSHKAIFLDEGISDWLTFWSEDLTTNNEARQAAVRAKKNQRGSKRIDGDETDVEAKAADAATTALSEQCDHARDHCEHGDPEACEYLAEECDFTEDDIAVIIGEEADEETTQTDLVTVGGSGGQFSGMEVTPGQASALKSSWGGYKAAIGNLTDALEMIREDIVNARQASRAINAIREDNGQDPLHWNRLHDLLSALDQLPQSVPETRTLAHFTEDGETDEDGEHVDVDPDPDPVPVSQTIGAEGIETGRGRKLDVGPPADRPAASETRPVADVAEATRRPREVSLTEEPVDRDTRTEREISEDAEAAGLNPETVFGQGEVLPDKPHSFAVEPDAWNKVPEVLNTLRRDYHQQQSKQQDGFRYEFERPDISNLIRRFNINVPSSGLRLNETEAKIMWAATAYYADEVGNTRELGKIEDGLIEGEYANRPEQDQTVEEEAAQQFAAEKQGTLNVDAEQEAIAEEKQVTLTGGDASDPSNQALPGTWEVAGTTAGVNGPTKWDGGPYRLRIEPNDPRGWRVVLTGPDNSLTLASDIEKEMAQSIAEGVVSRVDPPDVSFHHSDSVVPTAVAESKKEAIEDRGGGLAQFQGGEA